MAKSSNIAHMDYVTIKVYPETRKRLKQLAAALGIDMAVLAEQLLAAAWIEHHSGNDDNPPSWQPEQGPGR